MKKNSAWQLYETLHLMGLLIRPQQRDRRARWPRPHQGERECARRRRQSIRDEDARKWRAHMEYVRRVNNAHGAERWARAVSEFLEQNPRYKEDKVLHAMLDANVKILASDKANNDKPFDWFLVAAHRRVLSARSA